MGFKFEILVYKTALCFIIYQLHYSTVTGPLANRETLQNLVTCTTDNVVISCNANHWIAVEKALYVYHAGTCTAQKDDSDCFLALTSTESQTLIRACSGTTNCTHDMKVTKNFCAFGNNEVTYIYIEYYCIPESRIKPICSTDSMTSSSEVLFLTNKNYPVITTDNDNNCNCTLEVQSCSSDVNLYVVDLDLYQGVSNCDQHVRFYDNSGANIKSLDCENLYGSLPTTETLASNYLTISYDEQATVNSEGYFFIGLAATENGTTFTINCNDQPETWCIDCGTLPALDNGTLTLNSDPSYGSSATVSCNQGYDPSASTITCKEQGNWETANCTLKDCGALPSLDHGTLQHSGITTYGAEAQVSCDTGYKESTDKITCLASGIWESATCSTGKSSDTDSTDDGLSGGEIAGIVLGVLTATALLVAVVLWCNWGRIQRRLRGNTVGVEPEPSLGNSKDNSQETKGPAMDNHVERRPSRLPPIQNNKEMPHISSRLPPIAADSKFNFHDETL